jgi:hypothetical protein
MRPRSSNLPAVGLVFASQVILQVAHCREQSGTAQVLKYVHVLAPAAHNSKAFHQLGAVLRSEFIPVPLTCVGDKAAHLGVGLGAACPGEGGPWRETCSVSRVSLWAVWNLPVLGRRRRDQAAGCWLPFAYGKRPSKTPQRPVREVNGFSAHQSCEWRFTETWRFAIGQDPLDEVLAQGQVVEPALLLQGQQRETVHDLAGEHARAVALGHAVLACARAHARAL